MEKLILAPFIIFILFVVFLFVYFLYRRAWKIPAPNEALIIVGKAKGSHTSGVVAQDKIANSDASVVEQIQEDRLEGLDFRIATSATWVNPLTSRTSKLSLKSRSTQFAAEANDKDKIALSVRGVLLYKVGDNYDAMARAARRFLDIDEKEMNSYIENLVTGQVRALVGSMSIEELITNRQSLIDKAREATYEDMAKIGLQIDSLTIQEISDPNNYIDNLGRPQAEQVARDASVAADQARQAKEEAKQQADREIAQMRRDTEVIAAQAKADQDKAIETASQAGPLAQAEAKAKVVEQETKVAEMEVGMAAKRFDAEVRERAKADLFRVEQEAQGKKAMQIADAEAEAAAAEKIGKAKAEAIKAQGQAEAEATKAKSEALAQNGSLVIQQQIVDQMPEIARAVAEPLSSIDNLVVLDGPEGLTKTVTGGIATAGAAADEVMRLAKGMIGPKPNKHHGDDDDDGQPAELVKPAPGAKPSEDWETPDLASITPQYKATESNAGDLDNGRAEINVGNAGLDFRSTGSGDISDSFTKVLGRLHGFKAADTPELISDLQQDPDLVGAFNDVASDDQAFSQLLDELPVRGAKGNILKKFLGDYRDNVLKA